MAGTCRFETMLTLLFTVSSSRLLTRLVVFMVQDGVGDETEQVLLGWALSPLLFDLVDGIHQVFESRHLTIVARCKGVDSLWLSHF